MQMKGKQKLIEQEFTSPKVELCRNCIHIVLLNFPVSKSSQANQFLYPADDGCENTL